MQNIFNPNNDDITIQIICLKPEINFDIPIPCYMTQHAAGMDLHAAIDKEKIIKSNEIVLIPTGFAMAIPVGFEAQIRPRSGIAVKHGIGIINSPGTIDSDYRGEIMIPLINLGKEDYIIKRCDRIAQMVIQRVFQIKFKLVEKLDDTIRSKGGFGHTL